MFDQLHLWEDKLMYELHFLMERFRYFARSTWDTFYRIINDQRKYSSFNISNANACTPYFCFFFFPSLFLPFVFFLLDAIIYADHAHSYNTPYFFACLSADESTVNMNHTVILRLFCRWRQYKGTINKREKST
jgi:hypothetical protein